ncbi:PXR1, partial [Candida theae]
SQSSLTQEVMGLAGTKVKQRFGLDPRNTNWSNDTARFGHQYLSKMGWAPGSGLGLVKDSLTTHLKIHVKTDNAGLGAKLKKADKDKTLDECSGLDAFQRILGRLNGNEEKVNNVLDMKRNDAILNGKWGMRFVKGEVLSSTWDKDSKTLISYKNSQESKKRDFAEVDEGNLEENLRRKKTKLESDKSDEDETRRSEQDKDRKRKRKEKLDSEQKAKKKTKEKQAKKDRSAKEERSKKKAKKDKVDKGEEKEKKDKTKKKDKKEKKEKKEKKARKEKKERRNKPSNQDSDSIKVVLREKQDFDTSTSIVDSQSSRDSTPTPIASRLSGRAKYIKQKRASVMDPKALNEIFMISK